MQRASAAICCCRDSTACTREWRLRSKRYLLPSTLIAPPAFSNGPAEMLAIGATIAASFRFGVIATLAIGMSVLIAARAAGL
jgi:hypothetical protein